MIVQFLTVLFYLSTTRTLWRTTFRQSQNYKISIYYNKVLELYSPKIHLFFFLIGIHWCKHICFQSANKLLLLLLSSNSDACFFGSWLYNIATDKALHFLFRTILRITTMTYYHLVTGTAEQLWDWGGGGAPLVTQYWGGHKTLFLTNSL